MIVYRREAVRETLGLKLELERKALQIVERLLEDNMTEEFVISCVRIFKNCVQS